MAVDIDELQVRITANANTAQQALTGLANALKKVRNALTGVKDGATVADYLSNSLNSANNALHGISNNSIKKLDRLSDALQRYADAARALKGTGKISIGSSVKEAEKALTMDGMATSSGGSDSVEQTTDQVEKLGDEVEKAGKKAKKATGFFGKFIKSIGRIMLYRAIRSALKGIGEAFDTGLKNAYAFSQQHESFKRLADTMDRIKSVTSQMVNQLGAFWGEVKQFVLPVIEWITEKLRYGFERVTEFMAALNGEHQYLYARYVEEKWDDATESVKKYKHQLLGLDELNNLSNDPTGKLEGSTDPNKYYLKAVNDKVFDFANKLKDFTFNISDILFNWDDLDGQDIAKKIITGIGGVLGAVVGFTFGGVPGAIIGGIAGVTIAATIADMLFDSDKGKTYSKPGLRKLLYPALGALTGGLIGFTVFKGKGALIGMTAGAALGLLLSELLVKDDSDEDAYTIGEKITTVLAGITGAIIGWTVGSKTGGIGGGVKGALIGASFGVLISMAIRDFAEIANESGKSGLDVLELISSVLQMITIGVISWKVGAYFGTTLPGLAGVGIGASLAMMLFLLVGEINTANNTGMSSDDLLGKLIKYGLAGLVGAAIGAYLVGSGAGAMIGFNVGVSLTLILERINWDKPADSLANFFADIGDAFTGGSGSAKSYVQYRDESWDNMQSGKTGAAATISPYMFQKKAKGGVVAPGTGTLFLAGESGAEFVGNIGSTSAVANTGQMTEAIYKAAYMGMSKALKENGGNGMSGFEPATTDDLFIAMRKKASNYNKMTGNPAFS